MNTRSVFELRLAQQPFRKLVLNPLNAELNAICHLLALLGAHHILHVSRIKHLLMQPNKPAGPGNGTGGFGRALEVLQRGLREHR